MRGHIGRHQDRSHRGGDDRFDGGVVWFANAVGLLGPGEIRSTAPFPAAKTCDYHVPRGQAVLFGGRIIIR
jgi:hypothetical protein